MRRWTGVHADDVARVWPHIEEWAKKACARGRGEYHPEDIFDSLTARSTQLWVAYRDGRPDAAGVTEIVLYPRKKYARVLMGMGRDPHDLGDLIALFEAWAKAQGCDGVESPMRPGFETPFREAGWRKTHILMDKGI